LFTIIGVGLDANSGRALVDWDTFLKLYCIFDSGNIELNKLAAFWCKFFDINLDGRCPCADYEDLLEKLVRGKCLQANNQFSEIFKDTFKKQMSDAGCLGPEDEIMIDKMQVAFMN
jgi:hypothetical protein